MTGRQLGLLALAMFAFIAVIAEFHQSRLQDLRIRAQDARIEADYQMRMMRATYGIEP